ncbi:hypothetical protein EBAPG3_004930 [Nitrosospira lacus]|uniref:Uncharacterized protein n=1 Tax=Nitrosospira lacus TaxID=1288494 RepID=A0A1W6SMY5_9PROT|nr:hypothetical protein EBAPG3_004930 [Nitrosospira lacus]
MACQIQVKGNRLRERLAGAYFAFFLADGCISLQDLSSLRHFSASILQARQAATVAAEHDR